MSTVPKYMTNPVLPAATAGHCIGSAWLIQGFSCVIRYSIESKLFKSFIVVFFILKYLEEEKKVKSLSAGST